MHGVALRPEADYRLIYLREDDFHMRISDIYLGCSTSAGAPFLDVIFNEMWDVMLLLYLDTVQDTAEDHALDWNVVNELLRNQDPGEVAEFVWKHAGQKFVQLFERDLYLYLIDNQMNFFIRHEQDNTNRRSALLCNPTIVEVW